MMSLQELRDLVASTDLCLESESIIARGTLTDANGAMAAYEIREGWDIVLAHACDTTWGEFNVQLMQFIEKNVQPEQRDIVLSQIQIDDAHWDWLLKAARYKTDEYRWFFLTIDNKPQGACLIYQPKESVLGGGKIFYIEFLATAPWNRENPMCRRRFRSIGTCLISCAAKFAHDVLGLRFGFSLHALPRANAYYERLGMKTHPPSDYGGMAYYEMEEVIASKFGEGR